jgi:hypothetical protein
MARVLAAAAVVALIAAPSAAAKQFSRVIAVGADGRSVTIRSDAIESLLLAPRAAASVAAEDPYVLVYPIFETGRRALPGRPGRFYPAQRVLCFSWDRTVVGECGGVGDAGASLLAPAAGLATFTGDQTSLARLVMYHRQQVIGSNDAVAIELALNRARLARTARRPAFCAAATAVWRGPRAGSRPASFCVAAAGVWAAGRLYPLPRPLRST